jgi:phage FluMu protein Com
MPITVTCPSCKQMCAVADEHAGMQVRCPQCKNVITVPGAIPAAPVYTSPPPSSFAPPPPVVESPASTAPPGKSALAGLNEAASAVGLDSLARILVYCGWGCLGFMVLTVFLPWASVDLGGYSASSLGISSSGGLMTLFFTLEVGFLLVFFFFMSKNPQMFQTSLWAAAWWSVHASLWRFIDVIQEGRFAGWGLYLALVFSLGAAGTFGTLVIRRMSQRRS